VRRLEVRRPVLGAVVLSVCAGLSVLPRRYEGYDPNAITEMFLPWWDSQPRTEWGVPLTLYRRFPGRGFDDDEGAGGLQLVGAWIDLAVWVALAAAVSVRRVPHPLIQLLDAERAKAPLDREPETREQPPRETAREA
jgi:hypothetical protein